MTHPSRFQFLTLIYSTGVCAIIASSGCVDVQAQRNAAASTMSEHVILDTEARIPEVRDTIKSLVGQVRSGSTTLAGADSTYAAWLASYRSQHAAEIARAVREDSASSARIAKEVADRQASKAKWEACVRRVLASKRAEGASSSEQHLAATVDCADKDPGYREAVERDRRGY